MSADRRSTSEGRITQQALALGVEPGDVVVMHTSFRAVRPVEGGPEGLIAAIRRALGPEGTLVMPSWPGGGGPFDPATTPAAGDLGVVADTFWRLPGVLRNDHPQAFAAAGPSAARILADPLPLPPHREASPIGRVHELDGKVLLVGVGHEANTTLHLAELIARVPYRVRRHCTVVRDGLPVRVEYEENDHCCARFTLVDGWLRDRGLQSGGRIGHAPSTLVRARDVVEVTVQHLAGNPLTFLHAPGQGCEECDEARRSVEEEPNPIG